MTDIEKFRHLSLQHEVLRVRMNLRDHLLHSVVREIYDNITQVLVLARVQISSIEPHVASNDQQKIVSSGEMLGQAIRDLRKLCQQIYPLDPSDTNDHPLNRNYMRNYNVGLADDHVLLRHGLAGLINSLGFNVVLEASNGKELCEKMGQSPMPDVVLMDINMPEMDGYETCLWLRDKFPLVHVLALSMYDDERAIIRMIRNGARGYILKDIDPKELKSAIDSVMDKGFYYSEMVTGRLVHSIHNMDDSLREERVFLNLNEREIEFLKYACTEMTYKEIASVMHLSPRTIDGYRDALFEKLELKTRTGLVIYAIRNGIVKI